MKTRCRRGLFAALCCASELACTQPSALAAREATPLRGAAGSALLPFISEAAKAVHQRQAELVPQVVEARSSAAIRKLIDGEIELAFTSRSVRAGDIAEAQQKQRTLHMVVVGAEALAVIVHPDNPLRDVSSEQLRQVFFSGAVSDWSQLTDGGKNGPIHVLAVNPKTSGTGELFAATIASDDKLPYLATAKLADYSDATVAAVTADPDMISFTGMGNVTDGVRAVMLNKVTASAKSVLDTSYVLNRKLFAISAGQPKGDAREFVKFLLSEAGQNIARDNGVTPITLD